MNKSADFLAMPSNVPANLYNKGVPLKLLSITIWGILWVLTRDAKLNHIEDLKGQELTMLFKISLGVIDIYSPIKKFSIIIL